MLGFAEHVVTHDVFVEQQLRELVLFQNSAERKSVYFVRLRGAFATLVSVDVVHSFKGCEGSSTISIRATSVTS